MQPNKWPEYNWILQHDAAIAQATAFHAILLFIGTGIGPVNITVTLCACIRRNVALACMYKATRVWEDTPD